MTLESILLSSKVVTVAVSVLRAFGLRITSGPWRFRQFQRRGTMNLRWSSLVSACMQAPNRGSRRG
jgi:hypothetical protein